MASVFELLDREWERLAVDRQAARQLPEVCRLAAGATCLGDVERFVRGADPARADRVLLALVRRAVEQDGSAARVLLQLLLPGTRRLARRWWAVGDEDERAAAAVAAVYHRICSYPLARRPARVAANVLMDAAHELRRMVPPAVTMPCADPFEHAMGSPDSGRSRIRTATAPGLPDRHPADELGLVLREAVAGGVINHGDATLIARSRIAGHRVADVAQHLGLRPRTLWDRRQRAERALMGYRHDEAPKAASL